MGGELFTPGTRAVTTAAAPAGLSLSARSCARCHPQVYQAWETSRHRASYTNANFAASLAHSREKTWCTNCHLPLVQAQASAELAQEGISCATCHLRGGVVLSAREPTTLALRAHPVRVEPSMRTSSFCAQCHQFNFDDMRTRPMITFTSTPLQNTFAEWAASAWGPGGSNTPCQGCHDHGLGGGHDVERLRRAIKAKVVRTAEHFEVTVEAHGVGHAFPTGDPFRSLVVELCATEACGSVITSRAFHRIFGGDANGNWVLRADHSLPPSPPGSSMSERTVTLPAPPGSQPRAWRLLFVYADPRLTLPPEEMRVVLHWGRVERQLN